MKLGAAEIGILASVGQLHQIPAFDKPKIGILSTGNELVTADAHPSTGKIRDSNSPMLTAILKSQGFSDITFYGIVPDNEELIHNTFSKICKAEKCDIIVTSGGVSMGEKDLIKPYLHKEGDILFG